MLSTEIFSISQYQLLNKNFEVLSLTSGKLYMQTAQVLCNTVYFVDKSGILSLWTLPQYQKLTVDLAECTRSSHEVFVDVIA